MPSAESPVDTWDWGVSVQSNPLWMSQGSILV